jgi:DNA-binding response OmpR family regulator
MIDSAKGDILIVDDTLANLRLLSTMLTEQGYIVRGVPNGLTALKVVALEPPDLILLDINMPQMDGYQVCQALKNDNKACDIPVIFISAMDEVLDKIRAFGVGGVDYITKPFQMEEVLVRIENQLTVRRLQQQLQQANASLQASSHEVHHVAHQLKIPLTQVVDLAELLQAALGKENQPDTEKLEMIDRLKQNVRQSLGLVDTLLALPDTPDLSR